MEHQRSHTGKINRGHDDWDEVHNQLLNIQKKSIDVSDPNDASEKEADTVARKVVDGQPAQIRETGKGINRKPDGDAETKSDKKLDAIAIAEEVHRAINPESGKTKSELMAIAALKDLGGDAFKIKRTLKSYKNLFGVAMTDDITAKMDTTWQPLALELLSEQKEDDKGTKLVAATPSVDDDERIAADALNLRTAVKAANASGVINLLLAYDRKLELVMKLKQQYSKLLNIKVPESVLLEGLTTLDYDIQEKFQKNPDVMSYALFLLNGLAPTPSNGKEYVSTQAGGTGPKVPGGQIKSDKNKPYTFGKDTKSHKVGEISENGFSHSYQGGLSEESRWLQFVWREVIVYRGDKATPVALDFGNYVSEIKPESPHYSIDGHTGLKLPFYEGGKSKTKGETTGGANTRGKNETTIFDTPKASAGLINFLLSQQPDFDKITSVESRAHLVTYFIRHYSPYYKSTTDYTWVFPPAAMEDPAPAKVEQTSMEVDHLGEDKGDIRADMIADDPQLSYIR